VTFPRRALSEWRARVENDLAGRPFGTLVDRTLDGLAIEPLYVEAPTLPRVLGDGAPFRVCMRHEADTTRDAVVEDVEGGADALWIPRAAIRALPERLPQNVLVLADDGEEACELGGERAALVSTLPVHLDGADACDEVAIALAAAAERLRAGTGHLVVRVAAGRDTFVELAKLRALRLCLRKALAACGGQAPRLTIHAVASPRTVTARDPWVNVLRVTTQSFAAILGGADLVTPRAFDEALSPRSALGRRLARNTLHVLRYESGLGRVVDPAAGSYSLDTLTDSLARDGWARFRGIESEGGYAAALASGSVRERIAATRDARCDRIARRTLPVLGVSEYVNLDEELSGQPRVDPLADGAAFEALRACAETLPPERAEVALVTLGSPAEARARVAFAASLFAAGGLRARELAPREDPPPGGTACLCGSDERYAAEADSRARELRAAGVRRLLLAGRPGSRERELRDAGVDAFVFAGCDAAAVLGELVGDPS
jgi:methylmalonyl-CoA mutase